MKHDKANLLIVDDDTGHRLMLEALLDKWEYRVSLAENGVQAVAEVKERSFDAILMDIRMPDMDGLTALQAIKAYNPAVPVVIMTAYSAVDSAITALKSGAYDYLTKPLDFDVLKLTLARTLEHRQLAEENRRLRESGKGSAIVGNSPPIRQLLELIAAVAPSEATVLITGKSGTGKELVARSIHEQSARKDGPWVAVNCAALTESLLESELFGHEKGAFTGADKRREGRFLQADGGTLFLDEIGEISQMMQVKLLRALQQKEIQRVGSDITVPVDVRIVAATNRDLPTEIREGRFREDLYYRLNVVSLEVPSLHDRPEDIPLLAQHFLNIYAARNRKEVKGFSPQAMDMLLKYSWPGNVRELENAMERAVVLLFGSFITERELPRAITEAGTTLSAPEEKNLLTSTAPVRPGIQGGSSLEEMEKALILQTLQETRENKSEAAKRLGISRKTLHTKLKNYGI